jgi:hypothetical protein
MEASPPANPRMAAGREGPDLLAAGTEDLGLEPEESSSIPPRS